MRISSLIYCLKIEGLPSNLNTLWAGIFMKSEASEGLRARLIWRIFLYLGKYIFAFTFDHILPRCDGREDG
jgi:hypothetical protein